MACGIEIDVDDLVSEVIKKLDLSKYVTVDNGTANNLVLREGLTIDDHVKNYLCAVLGDCMTNGSGNSKQDCGCDNHTVAFSIDKVNDLLTIKLKQGETFTISKDELLKWLNITTSKDVHVDSGSVVNGNTIRLTLTDGSSVDVNVSGLLADKFVKSGSIVNSHILRLVLNDGTPIDIDLSAYNPSTAQQRGRVESGMFVQSSGTSYVLRLTRDDGTKFDISVPEFNSGGSPGTGVPSTDDYVVSGKIQGTDLILTRQKGGNVVVSLEGVDGLGSNDRYIKNAEMVGTELVLTYGTDTTPNMGTYKVELANSISVSTDGTTITGNGTTSNPLVATKGVKNVTLSGNTITVTLTDGTSFPIDLSSISGTSGVDTNTTNVSLEIVGNEIRLTDSANKTLKATLPTSSGGTVTFTLASSGTTPATSQDTALPTKMVGSRNMILGEPDAYIEQEIGGQIYLIPAYRKP